MVVRWWMVVWVVSGGSAGQEEGEQQGERDQTHVHPDRPLDTGRERLGGGPGGGHVPHASADEVAVGCAEEHHADQADTHRGTDPLTGREDPAGRARLAYRHPTQRDVEQRRDGQPGTEAGHEQRRDQVECRGRGAVVMQHPRQPDEPDQGDPGAELHHAAPEPACHPVGLAGGQRGAEGERHDGEAGAERAVPLSDLEEQRQGEEDGGEPGEVDEGHRNAHRETAGVQQLRAYRRVPAHPGTVRLPPGERREERGGGAQRHERPRRPAEQATLHQRQHEQHQRRTEQGDTDEVQ